MVVKEEEIREKALALKHDVQIAIIMANASEAPYVSLHINKAEDIYSLLNVITKEGKEE